MKKNFTQQEVLLLTGTHFTGRQYSMKDDSISSAKLTEEEKLEQACWNGMLPDMLPELFVYPEGRKKLYLWNIKEGASFLELEMGDYPEPKDNYFSIDPYSFILTKSPN